MPYVRKRGDQSEQKAWLLRIKKASGRNIKELTAFVVDESRKKQPDVDLGLTYHTMQNYLHGRSKLPLNVQQAISALFSEIPLSTPASGVSISARGRNTRVPFYTERLDEAELAKILKGVQGKYICYYDLGFDEGGGRRIHVRRYTIDGYDLDSCTLTGRCETKDHEQRLSVSHAGTIRVYVGERNRQLLSLIEDVPDRRRPPVYFMLHQVDMGNRRFLYGLGVGYRARIDSYIVAAKALLLEPINDAQFEEDHDYWNKEVIGEKKWKHLMDFFHGKIAEDSPATLHASPAFLLGEKRIDLTAIVAEIYRLDEKRYSGAS